MASQSDDANDITPTEFLRKIRDLSEQRDKEDAERYAQLEADIYRDREQRAARRAERARSLSPEKSAARSPTTMRERTPLSPPLTTSTPETTQTTAQTPTGLSRSGTLNWQQRPKSISSQRPLSQFAAENAARSPREPTSPQREEIDSPEPSRAQIASSLASRDPSWFRQTADRGVGSAAYRKNQVEDTPQQDISVGRQHLPGMARSPITKTATPPMSPPMSKPFLSALSPAEPQQSTAGWNNKITTTQTPEPTKHAMDPPRLAPAPESSNSRPASPTKGMGGFVQSAMMKRSDSVSKRWSQQATPGLVRQGSTASNRSSYHQDLGGLSASHSMPRLDRPSHSPTRGSSPMASSRPLSSHDDSLLSNDSTKTEDRVESMRSVAHTHNRSKSMASIRSDKDEISRPSSPTKKWSPTKSSWLESALSKPEEKPRSQYPLSQPAWMVNLNKAKAQKEEAAQAEKITPKVTPSPIAAELRQPRNVESETPTRPAKHPPPEITQKPASLLKEHSSPAALASIQSARPAVSPKPVFKSTEASPKPAIAPRIDFRGNLKPRQPTASDDKDKAPEFMSAFGNLRRAKTEKFVAPDIFTANIVSGKNALTVTGGPAKRERVDELKESLVKQKEAIKVKAAVEGPRKSSREVAPTKPPEAVALRRQITGGAAFRDPLLERKVKEEPVSEALARQKTIRGQVKPVVASKPALSATQGSENATTPAPRTEPLRTAATPIIEQRPATPTIEKRPATPASPDLSQGPFPGAVSKPGTPAPTPAVMMKSAPSSKLADRFNPMLANVLNRGPSHLTGGLGKPPSGGGGGSTSRAGTTTTSFAAAQSEETAKPSKDLTHMTKGRAKGPKRKAPSSKAAETSTTASKHEIAQSDVSKMATAGASADKPTPALSTKPKPIMTVPLVRADDVLPSVDATEVKPEPASQTLSKAKPLAPIKSPLLGARISSSSLRMPSTEGHGINGSALLVSPGASRPKDIQPPPNPAPLSLPIRQKASDLNSPSQTQSTARSSHSSADLTPPTSAISPKPALNLWSKPIPTLSSSNTPSKSLETKRSGSPTREEDDFSQVSVRNAMASWGRSPNTVSSNSNSNGTEPRVRSPIRLPTKDDEDRIHREAGLGLGLGIAADSAAAAGQQSSRSTTTLFPLSPPLSAGLLYLPDPINSEIDTEMSQQRPTTAGAGSKSLHLDTSAHLDPSAPSPKLAPSPLLMSKKSPRMQESSKAVSRPTSLSFKMAVAVPDSPTPHTSEARSLFADLFDAVPRISTPQPEFDIAAILQSNTSNCPPSEPLTTIRKQVFEISPDGNPVPIPTHQEHILFDESAFIVIHSYSLPVGTRGTEVFLWAGQDVPQAGTLNGLNLARKIAREHNARVLVVRQGKESEGFLQAMGGILLTFRGERRVTTKSGLPKTFMLCARRHLGHICIDEVDFELGSFCSGFAYIICSNSRLYVWKGRGCTGEELGCARLISMDLGVRDIIEVNEGDEPEGLFRLFPGQNASSRPSIPASSEHWVLKAKTPQYRCRLFRITLGDEAVAPLGRVNSAASSIISLPSDKDKTDGKSLSRESSISIKGRDRLPATVVSSSFFSAWGSAASNLAAGMGRKKSTATIVPLTTATTFSPAKMLSRPQTPVSPSSPSRIAGYFSAAGQSATSLSNGILGFRRRESSDSVVTTTGAMAALTISDQPCMPMFTSSTVDLMLQEIHPFTQTDLDDQGGIFILDAYFEIYILVRLRANDGKGIEARDFVSALLFAQDYAILATSMQDRPRVPRGIVLLGLFDGAAIRGVQHAAERLPRDFGVCFRDWSDEFMRGGHGILGGREVKGWKAVGLGAALAAVRG